MKQKETKEIHQTKEKNDINGTQETHNPGEGNEGREIPIPNREYKSTVFAMLYRDKERLLSLYNALNHTGHENPEELTIVTLENAIYMSMKNDVSFLVDHRLNLYEHQSTPNPNLPLRNLFYVSRQYEKLVMGQSLYGRKRVNIPAPRFVVLYNGSEDQPERAILKLSQLYETKEESPMLELAVEFININHNQRLKEECRSLKEYMEFIERIRHYADRGDRPLAEAVELAVTECIREGILAEFLEANRREVVSMSIFEYDEEKELKLLRQAEYELGLEEGEKRGQEIGERIGEKRGQELGEKRGQSAILQKMHKNGLTAEQIAAFTDQSPKEVRAILGIRKES